MRLLTIAASSLLLLGCGGPTPPKHARSAGTGLVILYERAEGGEAITADVQVRLDRTPLCRRSSSMGLVEPGRPLLVFRGEIRPGAHELDVLTMYELPWATGIAGEPRRGHLGPYGAHVRFTVAPGKPLVVRIVERARGSIRGDMEIETRVEPGPPFLEPLLACASGSL